MKVTIKDIVKESGLSYVTVSKAIRNDPSVKEENRKKVRQAMKALGYVPSAAARTLVTGKTHVIAVMVSDLGDGFFDRIIECLHGEFAKKGYLMTLSICKEDDMQNITFLEQKRVDGFVLMVPYKEKLLSDVLDKQKLPYIIMDNQMPGCKKYSILSDNRQGGYIATKYLLDKGFNKIALIGGEKESLSTKNRYAGAIEAMEGNGTRPYAIAYGEYDQLTGYATTKKWIEEKHMPQAIFAFDDHIALGAINALKDYGYKVPQDVSVIGYDDSLLANHYEPKITSVRQPAEEMAKKAVQALLDVLDGKEKPVHNTLFPPKLCIKESTDHNKKGE